jgi:hypothetical protein
MNINDCAAEVSLIGPGKYDKEILGESPRIAESPGGASPRTAVGSNASRDSFKGGLARRLSMEILAPRELDLTTELLLLLVLVVFTIRAGAGVALELLSQKVLSCTVSTLAVPGLNRFIWRRFFFGFFRGCMAWQ